MSFLQGDNNSFIFIDGHYSLDDQDVVIAWWTVLLQMTMVDYGIVATIDLLTINLVEMQRESTRVGVNTSLVKREC